MTETRNHASQRTDWQSELQSGVDGELAHAPELQTDGGRRIHIQRLLAVGGMSEVYVGYCSDTGSQVVIKAPRPELLCEQVTKRFKFREVRSHLQLKHPNIVEAIDYGEHLGRPFLVMELVEGPNLCELVESEGPLYWRHVCNIARQVASALVATHEAGIIHRDVKPKNIVVASDGTVKLLDWGLVCFESRMDREQLLATAPDCFLGTFDFTSPEQAENPTTTDYRSDLFLLGATLYFALTGQSPVQKFKRHVGKLQAYMVGEWPPLKRLNRRIPEAIANVVTRLMAVDADARYQSANELIVDLSTITNPSFARRTFWAVRTMSRSIAGAFHLLGKWSVGLIAAVGLVLFFCTAFFRPAEPRRASENTQLRSQQTVGETTGSTSEQAAHIDVDLEYPELTQMVRDCALMTENEKRAWLARLADLNLEQRIELCDILQTTEAALGTGDFDATLKRIAAGQLTISDGDSDAETNESDGSRRMVTTAVIPKSLSKRYPETIRLILMPHGLSEQQKRQHLKVLPSAGWLNAKHIRSLVTRDALIGRLNAMKEDETIPKTVESILVPPDIESAHPELVPLILRLEGMGPSQKQFLLFRLMTSRPAEVAQIQQSIENAELQKRRAAENQEIIEEQTAALELDPHSTAAYEARAAALIELQQHNEALCDLDEAIRLSPARNDLLTQRGRVLFYLSEYDKALEDLNTVIDKEPEHAAAYKHRAMVRHEKRELDAAVSDYDTAIRLSPQDDELYRLRGECNHRREDWDAAITDYSEYLARHPKSAYVYRNRGMVYRQSGHTEKALTDYDIAMLLEPCNPDAYRLRGYAFWIQERYEEALRDFDRVFELKKDEDVSTRYFRADCHYNLGDTRHAIEECRAILDAETDAGTTLNVVELTFVMEEMDVFEDARHKLTAATLTRSENAVLKCFEVLALLLRDRDVAEQEADLRRTLAGDEQFISWDWSELDAWVERSSIDASSKRKIEELLRVVKANTLPQ